MKFVENCPVYPEVKLEAESDVFIGMATAGYCEKCGAYYRWATGEKVESFGVTNGIRKFFLRLFGRSK